MVDCKPLQETVCGHCALLGDAQRPLLRRIASNLVEILDQEWSPPCPWHDPVLWRPRGYNVIADYLANLTMDEGVDWIREFPWPFHNCELNCCNIVSHSDGGARPNCSAAAWLVEVGVWQNCAWVYRPIAMGGVFLKAHVESFEAECLALERCSAYVNTLIVNKPAG